VVTRPETAAPRRRILRLTTAVRNFRRVSSSSTFSSRWLGEGDESIEGGQYDVLDRLSERESWRMGELAAALRVDPSAVTRAVLPLERRGFAERAQDPSDRRCVLVRATPAGRARHELARSRGLELWEEALQEFTDEELMQFAGFMERLTRTFETLVLGASDAQPVPSAPGRDRLGPDAQPLEHRVDELLRRLEHLEHQVSSAGAAEG
jgi:DNA-binding MarR family transcriptional regulator